MELTGSVCAKDSFTSFQFVTYATKGIEKCFKVPSNQNIIGILLSMGTILKHSISKAFPESEGGERHL